MLLTLVVEYGKKRGPFISKRTFLPQLIKSHLENFQTQDNKPHFRATRKIGKEGSLSRPLHT